MNNKELFFNSFEWPNKPSLEGFVDKMNSPVRWMFGGRTYKWIQEPSAQDLTVEKPSSALRVLGTLITLVTLPIFLLFQIVAIPTKLCSGNKELKAKALRAEQTQLFEEKIALFRQKFGAPNVAAREDHGAQIAAAQQGNLEICQWFFKDGLPEGWKDIFTQAAIHGHLPILEFMNTKGIAKEIALMKSQSKNQACSWTEDFCKNVIEKSKNPEKLVSTLDWLRKHNFPLNEKTCAAAAKAGLLEVLKWLWAKGCPWNENTCIEATRENHIDVLEWAMNHGCYWSAESYLETVKRGIAEVSAKLDYVESRISK